MRIVALLIAYYLFMIVSSSSEVVCVTQPLSKVLGDNEAEGNSMTCSFEVKR